MNLAFIFAATAKAPQPQPPTIARAQHPDLGVQLSEINNRLIWLAAGSEHIGGAVQQLCLRHSLICVGCKSCFCASSASVLSLRTACSATCALNAGK